MRSRLGIFVMFFGGVIPKVTMAEDEVEFQKELQTIEEDVNKMKKKVFSAKATLNLLRELVVQGSESGSRVNVHQIDQLGKSYALEKASYVLDGKPIYGRSDNFETTDLMVFEGEIGPGDHNLAVELELRGNGLGLFNYVNKYGFTIRNTISFSSQEGQNCAVRVIAETRSAFKYSYEERPNIIFQTICSEMSE